MSPALARPRTLRRIGAVLAAVAALIGSVDLTVPVSASARTTRVVSPGANLVAAFESLRAGDTLLLAPGTYNIRTLRPALARGTASAPITVAAQDSSRPPLLTGWLRLERPYYWAFSRLRIQATLPGHEAVDVYGGQGWSISGSEIFGAQQTAAYANIALFTYDNPSDRYTCGVNAPASACENPSGWSIVTSCVHNAGLGKAAGHGPSTDHNIYLTGAGNAPGRISRNILFGALDGAQVKIGSPGLNSGFSGVSIDHNTMHASAQGVLVAGNTINRTFVRYNLIKSVSPSTPKNVGAGLYLDAPGRALRAGETPNFAIHNYGAGIRTSTLYLSPRAYRFPGTYQESDNATANSAGADPKFNTGGCGGYRPGNPVAGRYGRYGTYFGSGY